MITQEDYKKWKALGWWGRFKRRMKYTGMSYEEVYKTLEWEEYTYWRFSNCTYFIFSSTAGLLPDIMKTPAKDRDRVAEAREESLERLLQNIKNKYVEEKGEI